MLQLNPHTGLLSHIRYLSSPNFDARPMGTQINLLVIHGISLPAGKFGASYIEALFCNHLDCAAHHSFADLENVHVSSHLFIDRAGVLTQFVPFTQRAWHAGLSQFGEQMNCNDFSIGIELEGTDTIPYTALQYKTLAEVTQVLLAHYPQITRERIVGHSDIAPGRKTDPGPAFDWSYYWKCLKELHGE